MEAEVALVIPDPSIRILGTLHVTCCTRAWCVGGIDFRVLLFFANSFLRAVLMSLQALVRLYIRMTNLAMLIQDSGISVC